jgi:four helix bundle protein
MSSINFRQTQNHPVHSTIRSTRFDHEKLEVYKQELEFIKWVTPMIEEAARSTSGRPREVCDQLDRASISTVLDTAEGNGKRQRQVRAKFFDDARGSGTECAACLDVLVAKGILSADKVGEGKNILLHVVCMLSGLVERFDENAGQFREDVVEYRTGSAIADKTRKRKTKRQRKN